MEFINKKKTVQQINCSKWQKNQLWIDPQILEIMKMLFFCNHGLILISEWSHCSCETLYMSYLQFDSKLIPSIDGFPMNKRWSRWFWCITELLSFQPLHCWNKFINQIKCSGVFWRHRTFGGSFSTRLPIRVLPYRLPSRRYWCSACSPSLDQVVFLQGGHITPISFRLYGISKYQGLQTYSWDTTFKICISRM